MMYLLRRTALKAALSTPSTLSVARARSITSVTLPKTRVQQQWAVSPFHRRFASETAEKETASPTEVSATDETIPTEQEKEASAESTAASEAAEATEQTESSNQESQTVASAISSATETAQERVQNATSQLKEATQANDAREAVQSIANAGAAVAGAGAGASSTFFGEQAAPNKILYVGNLFFEVTAAQLEREFQRFGKIVGTKIVSDQRGLSKGFGYVEFENVEDAGRAASELNQQVLEGRRMTVQYHKPRQASVRDLVNPARNNTPSKTLFIGNMSFEMSDKDLNDLFRDIRNVIDVRVAIDRRSGQPRGFAHADFIDVTSAEKAKALLQGKEIYGRKLRVDFSQDSRTSRGAPAGDR